MVDQGLLRAVAAKLGSAPSYAEDGRGNSLLVAAASAYTSATRADDLTQPTGFDPRAAALFEAVVESAYLVANADGDFDEAERAVFQHVVVSACRGAVAEPQVAALLADLDDLLREDGLERRVAMAARCIQNPEQAQEVLRVAALLAWISGGVSDPEREVMLKLGEAFGLGAEAIDLALTEVQRTVQSGQ